jgi:hypothetical protein
LGMPITPHLPVHLNAGTGLPQCYGEKVQLAGPKLLP